MEHHQRLLPVNSLLRFIHQVRILAMTIQSFLAGTLLQRDGTTGIYVDPGADTTLLVMMLGTFGPLQRHGRYPKAAIGESWWWWWWWCLHPCNSRCSEGTVIGGVCYGYYLRTPTRTGCGAFQTIELFHGQKTR